MFIFIFATFIILGSVWVFIRKVILKGRLEKGLGRRVRDNELTSITAWMDVDSKAAASSARQPGKRDGSK
jgi:hypothetical protein